MQRRDRIFIYILILTAFIFIGSSLNGQDRRRQGQNPQNISESEIVEERKEESTRWDDDVWAFSSTNHERHASMSYDYNNPERVFIAIERWSGTSAPKDIVVRRSTNHGESFGTDASNQLVITGSTDFPVTQPKLTQVQEAVMGLIFVEKFNDNDYDIYFKTFMTTNLSSASMNIPLNAEGGQILHRPAVTSDYVHYPTVPYVYAAWINDSGTPSIRFRRSTNGGDSWTSPETTVTTLSSAVAWNYQYLSIDCHVSRIAIAYVDRVGSYDAIKLVISTNGGTSWSAPITISTAVNKHFRFPQVRYVTQSNIIVTYEYWYSDTDRDIHCSYSTDGGATFFTNTMLAATSADERFPNVSSYKTLNGGSDVYISYTKLPTEVFIRKAVNLSYSAWTTAEQIKSSTLNMSQNDINSIIVKPAPEGFVIDMGSAVAWSAHYSTAPNDLCVFYDAEWRGEELPPPDPLIIPFNETWITNNFTENHWTAQNNWSVVAFGNPAPSAQFYYSPMQTNYNLELLSWDIDATGYQNVSASFDLNFSNFSYDTIEWLSFEVFDGSSWNAITHFTNQGGNINWTTYPYDISLYAANRVFKIRFRAHGVNSENINFWRLDNIELDIGPLQLPFNEEWVSGDLAANLWTAEDTNWFISAVNGNPAPTAQFNFSPLQADYNHDLLSWDIDASGYDNVSASFDLFLSTYNTLTLEQMSFEVYDGSSWITITTFNNQEGSFYWTTFLYDITPQAANRQFKIRFRAHGQNSFNINWWYLDNITLDLSPFELPFTEEWTSNDFVTNNWQADANWSVFGALGNPEPSARFYFLPNVTNYSQDLASHTLNGSGINYILAQFDLYLSNYDTATVEQLSFEVFNGTEWITINTFNNQGGNIPWTTLSYDISEYVADRLFKIRFRAHGENNYNIDYWHIDNFSVAAGELLPPANLSAIPSYDHILLNWKDPHTLYDTFRYDSGEPYLNWGYPAGNVNNVIGAAHRRDAQIHEVEWFTTSVGGPHNYVNLFIFGLDEDGMPDGTNILFQASSIPSTDLQWNVYRLPSPIDTPDGFLIGLNYDGFLGLATDNGSSPPWNFEPNTQFFTADYTGNVWQTLEYNGYNMSFLIRANGYDYGEISYREESVHSHHEKISPDPFQNRNNNLDNATNNYDSIPSIELQEIGQVFTEMTNRSVRQDKRTHVRGITGYNVYRDGVIINPEMIPDTSYTDYDVLIGTNYSYYVTAVYIMEETGASETLMVETLLPPAPLELPFTEDWASMTLHANLWSHDSNWATTTYTGNPIPCARFYQYPYHLNYNRNLTSWGLDANSFDTITIQYDVSLTNFSSSTVEALSFEVFDGSIWHTIHTYNNMAGSFPWTTGNHDISEFAGNRIFKIRFRVYGEDSSNIYWWRLDNIIINANTSELAAPVVSITTAGGYVTLTWEPVAGANSYLIYASPDPYAEDWGDPIAVIVTTLSYSELITSEKKFYRVVASSAVTATLRIPLMERDEK